MNDVFMVTGGKNTQKIEGAIEVAPTVGGATEAKQDAILAELQMKADLSETQPVSAATLPLPTGAATSARQDTGNTSIASIDTKTPALGQALAAGSVPVVLPAAQITTLTPPAAITGFLTEADFDSKTGSLTEGAPASDTASSGLNGRLQRIAQRITSLIALLPTALGQGTMATSLKVVLPSDQSAIPVTVASTTVTGTVAVTQSGTWDEVGINDSGNSITVDAVDLDVRNLVFATDKVDASGSTVQDVPATTGGLSKFHLVGAATTNATNIKASAGQVYAITAFNITAVPIWLKFHNTAGTPTAGSGVTDSYLIPANTAGTGVIINIDKGITFATGIGITLVTGIADADATAIAASSVVLNIYYK